LSEAERECEETDGEGGDAGIRGGDISMTEDSFASCWFGDAGGNDVNSKSRSKYKGMITSTFHSSPNNADQQVLLPFRISVVLVIHAA
jgi:hypothetical protein